MQSKRSFGTSSGAGGGGGGGGGAGGGSSGALVALVLLLAAQRCVSAQQLTNEVVDEKVLKLLELGRGVMPHGFPELGVPALDPWRINKFAASIEETSLKLDFEAYGMNISNARTFVVNSLRTSIGPRRSTVDIDITIPMLRITADNYNMAGKAMIFFSVKGKGKMEASSMCCCSLSLRNVRLLGTLTVDPAVPTIEDLLLHISVASVQAKLTGTSSLVNRLLSQHGASLLSDKSDDIAAAVRAQLLPPLNEYLALTSQRDLRTLLDAI